MNNRTGGEMANEAKRPDNQAEKWHVERGLNVNTIINGLVLLGLVGLWVGGRWFDLFATDQDNAARLDAATTKIERVASDLGGIEQTAADAFAMASENRNRISALSARQERARDDRRDILNRLEGRLQRIEQLLMNQNDGSGP